MESAAVLYARVPAAALDLSLEAARDCFTWSDDNFEDNVEQHVLRRLFAADQELLQVGCDISDQPADSLRAAETRAAAAAAVQSLLGSAVCICLDSLHTMCHDIQSETAKGPVLMREFMFTL
jgi:hypothetical protein